MTIGVPLFQPCAGVHEFTVRRDTRIYAPAECLVEMRLPTGSIWRPQVTPFVATVGQHIRISQRSV
jgi:hypothetical protein